MGFAGQRRVRNCGMQVIGINARSGFCPFVLKLSVRKSMIMESVYVRRLVASFVVGRTGSVLLHQGFGTRSASRCRSIGKRTEEFARGVSGWVLGRSEAVAVKLIRTDRAI